MSLETNHVPQHYDPPPPPRQVDLYLATAARAVLTVHRDQEWADADQRGHVVQAARQAGLSFEEIGAILGEPAADLDAEHLRFLARRVGGDYR